MRSISRSQILSLSNFTYFYPHRIVYTIYISISSILPKVSPCPYKISVSSISAPSPCLFVDCLAPNNSISHSYCQFPSPPPHCTSRTDTRLDTLDPYSMPFKHSWALNVILSSHGVGNFTLQSLQLVRTDVRSLGRCSHLGQCRGEQHQEDRPRDNSYCQQSHSRHKSTRVKCGDHGKSRG